MRSAPGHASPTPWNDFVLSTAFLLTGVGTALLGAALPAMLAEWHLTDRGGGSLLFSSFAGSTLGALLVHGRFRLLSACGLAATAVAAFFLGQIRGGWLGPAFLLYGLGLGVAMTAISLLRSRAVPPEDSNLEMNRLNLLWAIGACLAPVLALRSLHLVSVRTLFLCSALAFGMAAAALLLSSPAAVAARFVPTPLPLPLAALVPVRLCLLGAAAVALETAIGAWLTTYTERMAHGVGIAVWANVTFWAGLLLSRALHSFRSGPWLQAPRTTAAHLAAVVLSMILLVAAPRERVLPVAALLAGLGLGPLYPLALSLALPRYRSNAIFVASGIGAAVLPWVTGTVSTAFHSLRMGLLAPCASVVILLAAAADTWRHLSDEL